MSRCSGIQLGRIDYERKEKASISGDGLEGEGRWKRKKVREHKKKKRLRRKNFKLLDFVKMDLEKL